MDGADRGTLCRQHRVLPPKSLPNFGRTPRRIVLFEPDNESLGRQRQLIRMALRPATPIGQTINATAFIAVVNLVARFPRDPELLAQPGHLLAVEQTGNKPETFVHDMTLLPRHIPSCRRCKVSLMSPE